MKLGYKVTSAVVALVMLGCMMPVSAKADAARAHKWLGFTTVALAGTTALTSSEVDTHEPLAYATAAMALSTVATGIMAHGDRFDTSEGLLTQDNSHIMLGTLGAIMLTAGVLLAADSYDEDTEDVDMAHAGLAGAGAAMMAIAIIDIRW
jgi:drug/metabolite transporter (DMT)-like permease